MNPARILGRIGLALLLGVATFVAASVCLVYLNAGERAVGLWLPNGIPLAVLLRTSKRRWPLLIAAAFIGNMAASLAMQATTPVFTVVTGLANVAQYSLIALVLRARFGAYFDLLQMRHVLWLCALSIPATVLKSGIQFVAGFMSGYGALVPKYTFPWFLAYVLGIFVLSLPLLAMSSATPKRAARLDAFGYGLIACLIALVFATFGPFAFPGLFVIIPPLMLLAWRYGLFGAGLGALLTNIVGSVLAITTDGVAARLLESGYDSNEIGVLLELFFNVAILCSLPVAVARAQQQSTDAALAAALSSTERRATQLAESEAAIRKSQVILKQSEERFRTIFERAPLGIAVVDGVTHRFVDANPKFIEIVGWPLSKLRRKTWQAISNPDFLDDELDNAAAFIAGIEQDFQTEKSYVRADGKLVWVNLAAGRMYTPGVEHDRFLVMIEDVTERKALQQQIEVVERLDAVGQLTGGIAHDFNNLLTVIIGSSETLAEDLDDPEHREVANLILDTAERAGELTRHLLAFARRQPLSPRALDINRLLEESEPLIRRTLGANLHFTISMAADVKPVFADRGQTEAAILNLCLNARDAMPNGGRLTIATENATFDDEFTRSHSGARPGEFVAIRVSDTGTGIPPEVLDHIFEPFFTTKDASRGTGLGLSMVYGFVKQSNGYVDVQTEEGLGSVFSLYLPAGTSKAGVSEPVGKTAVQRGSETVLLVEDDDLVRAHVRTQLDSLGYQVIEAVDGPAAMKILASREDIALLFTDVMMPGGMNGRELAEWARALRPGLRVLISSGYSNEMLMESGRLMEDVTLLPKPYSKRQLSDRLREAL